MLYSEVCNHLYSVYKLPPTLDLCLSIRKEKGVIELKLDNLNYLVLYIPMKYKQYKYLIKVK